MRNVTSELWNKYQEQCNTPSDINEHLPVLLEYASQCKSIVELGVRGVVSTWAFLAAKPEKLLSVDIQPCGLALPSRLAKENEIDFKFMLADDLTIVLDPVDLLFIDTLHSYDQLSKELALHGNKAERWIIMHDTTTYANIGMPDNHTPYGEGVKGMWPAIEEFLAANSNWSIRQRFVNNNGLTILERSV